MGSPLDLNDIRKRLGKTYDFTDTPEETIETATQIPHHPTEGRARMNQETQDDLGTTYEAPPEQTNIEDQWRRDPQTPSRKHRDGHKVWCRVPSACLTPEEELTRDITYEPN